MRLMDFLAPRLVAVALSVGALAAAPPIVGQAAPDFTLQALGGSTITLSDVIATGPAALFMMRGYPGYQCPACNRQTHDFIEHADDFKEAGVRLLFVYPGPSADLQSRAEEFIADKTFPPHFTLLLDPDYQFTNLYGLRWEAANETAYPSTFLIGTDGKIFFSKISSTHGDRSSAAEVLELFEKK